MKIYNNNIFFLCSSKSLQNLNIHLQKSSNDNSHTSLPMCKVALYKVHFWMLCRPQDQPIIIDKNLPLYFSFSFLEDKEVDLLILKNLFTWFPLDTTQDSSRYKITLSSSLRVTPHFQPKDCWGIKYISLTNYGYTFFKLYCIELK